MFFLKDVYTHPLVLTFELRHFKTNNAAANFTLAADERRVY